MSYLIIWEFRWALVCECVCLRVCLSECMSACLSHCLCVWLSECLSVYVSVCIFVRVCVYVRSNKYGLVKSYKMLVAQLPCGKRIQHKMSPISATTLPGNRRRHYHPNMTFLGVSFPSVSPSVRICSVCVSILLFRRRIRIILPCSSQDTGCGIPRPWGNLDRWVQFRISNTWSSPDATVDCRMLWTSDHQHLQNHQNTHNHFHSVSYASV